MTSAQHRAAIDAEPRPLAGPAVNGAGVWWVAWRQHRLQVAVLLAIVAVGAAALALLRSRIVAVFHEFGCELFPAVQGIPIGDDCVDANGVGVWWSHQFYLWSGWAHTAMVAGPIVLGVFAAAPIFTREFAHGTHVLALTQSVGRMRWFAAKTTVVAVPMIAGLLLLGFLMEWTDKAVGVTAYGALNQLNFFARALIPAATGLMAFGLALAIGMITRSILAALIVGALLGGAILFGLAIIQPYVLPADRIATPLAQMYPPMTQADIDPAMAGNAAPQATGIDRDRVFVGSGYLGADGRTVSVPNEAMSTCYQTAGTAAEAAAVAAGLSPEPVGAAQGSDDVVAAHAHSDAFYNSPEYQTALNASVLTCMTDRGVAESYQDYLPGSMLWPLRWAIAGICVMLAALFLSVSGWRLRSAIAQR